MTVKRKLVLVAALSAVMVGFYHGCANVHNWPLFVTEEEGEREVILREEKQLPAPPPQPAEVPQVTQREPAPQRVLPAPPPYASLPRPEPERPPEERPELPRDPEVTPKSPQEGSMPRSPSKSARHLPAGQPRETVEEEEHLQTEMTEAQRRFVDAFEPLELKVDQEGLARLAERQSEVFRLEAATAMVSDEAEEARRNIMAAMTYLAADGDPVMGSRRLSQWYCRMAELIPDKALAYENISQCWAWMEENGLKPKGMARVRLWYAFLYGVE